MIVLITGTSCGIGQATAARLGGAGHAVFAGRLDGPSAAPPEGVTELPLDVRSEESVAAFVEAALARGGRIDALVNNAAYGLSGSLEETTIAEAQKVLDTNLFGAVRTVRAVLPHFRKQGGGRIVNISSGAGFTAEPFAGWYTVSKFAVEGFSETLWHEVRALRRACLAGAARLVPHQHRARRRLHRASGRRLRPVAQGVHGGGGGVPRGRHAARPRRALRAARAECATAAAALSCGSRRDLVVLVPPRSAGGLFHRLVHRYYRLHQPRLP